MEVNEMQVGVASCRFVPTRKRWLRHSNRKFFFDICNGLLEHIFFEMFQNVSFRLLALSCEQCYVHILIGSLISL